MLLWQIYLYVQCTYKSCFEWPVKIKELSLCNFFILTQYNGHIYNNDNSSNIIVHSNTPNARIQYNHNNNNNNCQCVCSKGQITYITEKIAWKASKHKQNRLIC